MLRLICSFRRRKLWLSFEREPVRSFTKWSWFRYPAVSQPYARARKGSIVGEGIYATCWSTYKWMERLQCYIPIGINRPTSGRCTLENLLVAIRHGPQYQNQNGLTWVLSWVKGENVVLALGKSVCLTGRPVMQIAIFPALSMDDHFHRSEDVILLIKKPLPVIWQPSMD